jgi:hypothetical protein
MTLLSIKPSMHDERMVTHLFLSVSGQQVCRGIDRTGGLTRPVCGALLARKHRYLF